MCIKSNVSCIVIGIMRVVKPIQSVVPDLEELIIREMKKKTCTQKLKDGFFVY